MSRDGSPRVRRINDVLPLFTKVATTSHYELSFPAMPWQLLTYIKLKSDDTIDNAFVFRDLGLLCKGASLPGTAYATAQINGNYMGINQKYAHTRIYTDSSFIPEPVSDTKNKYSSLSSSMTIEIFPLSE